MFLTRYLKYSIKPLQERRFVYSRYDRVLRSMSDSSRYQIMPLKDFSREKYREDRVTIFLRHDVDYDLTGALEMARIEHKYGFRGTYFILHSARYYGITRKNYVRHNDRIIPILLKMQDEYGHEIGWHNDLVTLECIYGVNPREYLQEELQWLRNNGIKIAGVAAHDSIYRRRFNYHNRYFFHDLSDNSLCEQLVNVNGDQRFITKAYLKDFDLEYEAYNVEGISSSFGDCDFIGNKRRRWSLEDLRLADFGLGARIIIVIHPIHWARSICDKYMKLVSLLLPGDLTSIHT